MMHDNAIDTLASRIDKYVTHNMCMYARKSRRAYEMQEPTYFMGKFECMYQFAYQLIDSESVADAIEFITDDCLWYKQRYTDRQIIDRPFMHGYVDMGDTIRKFMIAAYHEYLNDCDDDYVWHVFDVMDFSDIANAIN